MKDNQRLIKDYLRLIKKRRYSCECPYCKEIAFVYKIVRNSLKISPDRKTATFDAITDTLVCECCNKNLSAFFSWKATLSVHKT